MNVHDTFFHAGDMVDAPICAREEMPVVNIDGDYLILLDKNNYTKEDLNLPEAEHLKDVRSTIKNLYDNGKSVIVTVLNCMGTEQIIAAKEK